MSILSATEIVKSLFSSKLTSVVLTSNFAPLKFVEFSNRITELFAEPSITASERKYKSKSAILLFISASNLLLSLSSIFVESAVRLSLVLDFPELLYKN